MKRKRLTEEQIVGVLREHEAGARTREICRRHGISEQIPLEVEGGMEVAGTRRLPELEAENGKLKRGAVFPTPSLQREGFLCHAEAWQHPRMKPRLSSTSG